MNLDAHRRLIAATFATAAFSAAVPALAGEPDHRAEVAEHRLDAGPDVVVEEERDSLDVAFLVDPVSHALSPAFGIALVRPEVQIAMGDYLALDLMPGFAHYFGGPDDLSVNAGGGQVGLRIAPYGTGLRGFYMVPRVGVVYGEGSSATESLDTTVVSPTLELGYSWIFGNFVMNAGGGAGYNFTVDGYDIYQDSPIGGFQLLANFSIGFGL